MTQKSGRAWDLEHEYSSVKSKEFLADQQVIIKHLETLEQQSQAIQSSLSTVENCSSDAINKHFEACYVALERGQEIDKLLGNLYTYVNCSLSIDGKNDDAKQARSMLEPMYARYSQAMEPFSQFLIRIADKDFEQFVKDPRTSGEKFRLRFERRLRHAVLSLEQEQLLLAMGINGFTAWGNLYDNVTATLRGELDLPEGKKSVGVAELSGYLQNPSESIRKMAWQARNAMWETQQDACAAALNAIAGWRLESNKLRSTKKTVGFLDSPLHKNRILPETLAAMLSAVANKAQNVRPTLKTFAKALKKPKLAAWDLTAPPPKFSDGGKQEFSYETGVEIVTKAFETVDVQMSAFVKMMNDKQWSEGRVLPTKRHGAYCTSFPKSQTPRVFMTYQGNMSNITTLAHELGHALHFWVMRDLPDGEKSVPMTLAETASVFAETVTREALEQRATNLQERFESAWYDAQAATMFLLNIPARFEFEKTFYERRQERELSTDELKTMMVQCMQNHYGQEVDLELTNMHWTSTLHYYITEISFYNFPYTFGYLFALGIYAQWKKLGNKFYAKYVEILRDTGRMTPEELVQKHLQMDITKQDFWFDSLKIVDDKLKNFEKLTNEIVG